MNVCELLKMCLLRGKLRKLVIFNENSSCGDLHSVPERSNPPFASLGVVLGGGGSTGPL